MKKLLISTGAAALALTSAPALAATPTTQATANARILAPLSIESVRDLDLGDIVLSGTGPYTEVVSISAAGAPSTCVNVTCSGTRETAQYTVTGTRDQDVTVSVSSTIDLDNLTDTAAPDLTLTVDAPDTVTLDATGEVTFDIGGSISVSDDTAEGVYQGTFDVTAEYAA